MQLWNFVIRDDAGKGQHNVLGCEFGSQIAGRRQSGRQRHLYLIGKAGAVPSGIQGFHGVADEAGRMLLFEGRRRSIRGAGDDGCGSDWS